MSIRNFQSIFFTKRWYLLGGVLLALILIAIFLGGVSEPGGAVPAMGLSLGSPPATAMAHGS